MTSSPNSPSGFDNNSHSRPSRLGVTPIDMNMKVEHHQGSSTYWSVYCKLLTYAVNCTILAKELSVCPSSIWGYHLVPHSYWIFRSRRPRWPWVLERSRTFAFPASEQTCTPWLVSTCRQLWSPSLLFCSVSPHLNKESPGLIPRGHHLARLLLGRPGPDTNRSTPQPFLNIYATLQDSQECRPRRRDCS
jgi:hypothetical protein